MSRSNKIYTKRIIICIIVILISNIFIFLGMKISLVNNMEIQIDLKVDKNTEFQMFYSKNTEFKEEESIKFHYDTENEFKKTKFIVPIYSDNLRLDMGTSDSKVIIKNIAVRVGKKVQKVDFGIIENGINSSVKQIDNNGSMLIIDTNAGDPYSILDMNYLDMQNLLGTSQNMYIAIIKIFICFLVDVFLIYLFIFSKGILSIPIELIKNYKLIWSLAITDFKTKYAGSYFGVFWIFAQPVVTILLYWVVFQYGLRAGEMNNYPFVLWLVAGLVPWFYFQDGLIAAMNSLFEYSYLVKKVVFQISILPSVKIISAAFIHAIFMIFVLILYFVMGYFPTVYAFQLIYYFICMWIFITVLSYITSALILFFKDLGQMINIMMQVFMWASPIMWNEAIVPSKYLWIFKINPVYYIVQGYRDSLLNKVWIWERMNLTIYFWLVILVLFTIGVTLFNKLKPHFADVL